MENDHRDQTDENTAVNKRAGGGGDYAEDMSSLAVDLPHASHPVRVRMVLGAMQLIGLVMFALPFVFTVAYDGVAPQAAAVAGASIALVATVLAANIGEKSSLHALLLPNAAAVALVLAGPATLVALFSEAAVDVALMLVWVSAILALLALVIRLGCTLVRCLRADNTLRCTAEELCAYVPFARPLYNLGFAGFARRQTHRLEQSAEQLPDKL